MERWGILDKLGFCSIPLAVNFILLSIVLEATSNPFWNESIVISNQTVSLCLYSRKNCISSNIGLKIVGFNWKTVSSIPFSLNLKDTDYISKTVSLKATKTSKINHQELLSLETRQCLTPGGHSYRGELCGDHIDLCLPRAGPHGRLGRPVLPGRWPLTKPSCEGLCGLRHGSCFGRSLTFKCGSPANQDSNLSDCQSRLCWQWTWRSFRSTIRIKGGAGLLNFK